MMGALWGRGRLRVGPVAPPQHPGAMSDVWRSFGRLLSDDASCRQAWVRTRRSCWRAFFTAAEATASSRIGIQLRTLAHAGSEDLVAADGRNEEREKYSQERALCEGFCTAQTLHATSFERTQDRTCVISPLSANSGATPCTGGLAVFPPTCARAGSFRRDRLNSTPSRLAKLESLSFASVNLDASGASPCWCLVVLGLLLASSRRRHFRFCVSAGRSSFRTRACPLCMHKGREDGRKSSQSVVVLWAQDRR